MSSRLSSPIRTVCWRAAMLVFLVALVPSSAGAVEYLGNPGFETGDFPPWEPAPKSGWNVVSSTAHFGAYSACRINDPSYTSTFFAQTFPSVDTANITSLTLWAKANEPHIVQVGLGYGGPPEPSLGNFDFVELHPGDDWTPFDLTDALRPPGNRLQTIQLHGWYTSDPAPPVIPEAYFDDVSLQVDFSTSVEPATWGRIRSILER